MNKKLTELQNKRLEEVRKESEEMQKESERALAELKEKTDISSKSISGVLGFWMWLYLQGTVISGMIQIIILSFFIRTIVLTLAPLDGRDLAGHCLRVAVLALLTLTLLLLMGILPLTQWTLSACWVGFFPSSASLTISGRGHSWSKRRDSLAIISTRNRSELSGTK